MLVSIGNLVIVLVPEQSSSRYFKDSPVLCLLVGDNIILPRDYKHIRRRQFCVSQRIGRAFLPATESFNPIRFRRSVSSMFYIYCFLLVCFLPYTRIIVFVNRYQLTPLTLALNNAFCSLLFFNSALNPLVFCRRIQEIRETVRRTLPFLLAW